MKDLKQTLAVVTGAASGMGLAVAEYLRAQAALVVGLDLRAAEQTDIHWLETDVSNEQSVKNAFEKIAQFDQPLRVCINCAGIAPVTKLLDRNQQANPFSDFHKVLQVNLNGTYLVMAQAAALMAKTEPEQNTGERGVIINTASIAAFEGQVGQMAYAASKGAVVSMALPAARELARHAIRVMTIAPGLIDTSMLSKIPDKARAGLLASTPYPKRAGQPEEFARLCAEIIHNPMLNGSVIRLDGALRMA